MYVTPGHHSFYDASKMLLGVGLVGKSAIRVAYICHASAEIYLENCILKLCFLSLFMLFCVQCPGKNLAVTKGFFHSGIVPGNPRQLIISTLDSSANTTKALVRMSVSYLDLLAAAARFAVLPTSLEVTGRCDVPNVSENDALLSNEAHSA